MAEATAIARYVRVSPQKARLVVDLIRGKKAEEALHLLRFTRKRIAANVEKLLQSAIANATDRGELDVDALYVTQAFVNEGPRQKRIRPAPMGRAYRYQRRSAHIEVHVGERPGAAPAGTVPAPAAKPKAKAAPKGAAQPKARPKKTISKLAAQRSKVPGKGKTAAKPSPAKGGKAKGGSKNKGGE
ncbi:MAG TPA: 50S ribosomal protein L22 [Terriglobales bacterium]|nr:50S ribosomal protein L22 [Terriglobales bacterium]